MGANISVDTKDIDLDKNRSNNVLVFTEANFNGKVYEIDPGNYTSNIFVNQIYPDNISSIIVPQNMSVKLYAGDIYDYGGKGSYSLSNVTKQRISIAKLPSNIINNVRSISVSEISQNNNVSNTDSFDQFKLNDELIENFSDNKYNNSNIRLIILMTLLIIICCKILI